MIHFKTPRGVRNDKYPSIHPTTHRINHLSNKTSWISHIATITTFCPSHSVSFAYFTFLPSHPILDWEAIHQLLHRHIRPLEPFHRTLCHWSIIIPTAVPVPPTHPTAMSHRLAFLSYQILITAFRDYWLCTKSHNSPSDLRHTSNTLSLSLADSLISHLLPLQRLRLNSVSGLFIRLRSDRQPSKVLKILIYQFKNVCAFPPSPPRYVTYRFVPLTFPCLVLPAPRCCSFSSSPISIYATLHVYQ